MTTPLVVAEHRDGAVRNVTFEAIAAAATVSDGPVDLVLIAPDPDELVGHVQVAPIETIHTVSYPEVFNHDVYVQAVTELAGALEPSCIVAANTANGLDFVPAVATALDWPLITDVVSLDRSDAEIVVLRDRYASKVETELTVPAGPAIFSIRPGEWQPASETAEPAVVDAAVDIDPELVRSTVERIESVADGGDVDITAADVLVSVGRGIGDEEHLELIDQLADALGATVSASRPIVDAGWLPKDRQVGQSGATVTPDIYLAIGISGAVQHVAGMKGADTIIAINTDPNAPIFDIADIGIVADLFEVVPAILDALDG